MHSLNTTTDRYYKLLMYLHRTKSLYNMIDVLKERGITTTLNTLLQQKNLIAKRGKEWVWIGGKPTPKMAKDVLRRCNAIVRSYQRKRNRFTPTARKYVNVRDLYDERKELLERLHKIDLIIKTAQTL